MATASPARTRARTPSPTLSRRRRVGRRLVPAGAQLPRGVELGTALTVARAGFDAGAVSRAARRGAEAHRGGRRRRERPPSPSSVMPNHVRRSRRRDRSKAIAIDAVTASKSVSARRRSTDRRDLRTRRSEVLRNGLQRDRRQLRCSTKLKRLKRIVDEKARIIRDRRPHVDRCRAGGGAEAPTAMTIDAPPTSLCATLHVALAEAFKCDGEMTAVALAASARKGPSKSLGGGEGGRRRRRRRRCGGDSRRPRIAGRRGGAQVAGTFRDGQRGVLAPRKRDRRARSGSSAIVAVPAKARALQGPARREGPATERRATQVAAGASPVITSRVAESRRGAPSKCAAPA